MIYIVVNIPCLYQVAPSFAGSTFLIQPGPEGSNTPLITAVSRPLGSESPPSSSLSPPPGSSPAHSSLSYATRVSPATIQWLIGKDDFGAMYYY